MFNLGFFDYIYILVVLVSTIWATVRGGVYETIATLSWVVAAVTSKYLSPLLDKQFQIWFKLNEQTLGSMIISYTIVFAVVLLIFSFFNQNLRDKIQESILKITDHSLGVIFGIVRGVLIMGLLYWLLLWYYSDESVNPPFLSEARTRPIMQLTALKINSWFMPTTDKILLNDMKGKKEKINTYKNLINPAVKKSTKKNIDTGYKESERDSLEKQLFQIDALMKAKHK